MIATLLGKKIGMTQVYDAENVLIPVTVVEAGPCPVVQVKTPEGDGYNAVQLGFAKKKVKNTSQAELNHAKKAGLVEAPRVLREVRLAEPPAVKPGDVVDVTIFKEGQLVDVIGVSKGKGFQGNQDRTNYFETLPANQLDLGLFLEADRMKSLAVTQANLDNQRNAVQEERRLRVDNQPYGKTSEAISDTAYDNFGYKHSTIGSMADLNAASLEELKEFFRIYYAPNNAVLALVGDFKQDQALAQIKKYFEGIPSQPAPKRPDMTEPQQTAERRKVIEDGFAQVPRLDIVYKIPAYNEPDYMPLNVLMSILGSGQSSRLYQELVKEKQLAANVFANAGARRATGLATVIALVRPGVKMEDVEKTIFAEIGKVQAEPVADWELEKVRLKYRHDHSAQLSSTLSRAVQLAYYTVAWNDPEVINTEETRLDAVTKDDLLRVARKYLIPANRSVITTLPKSKAAAGATGGN